MKPNRVVLASASPRRREMLEKFNVKFDVVPSDVDENIACDMPCGEYVNTLARLKGEAVRDMMLSRGEDISNTLIISCDTVVYFDKTIIGKPESNLGARLTLQILSDSWHEVYSGLCLIYGDTEICDTAVTRVKFSCLDERDIERYVSSGEPFGKAGSYAVQGRGAAFVERTEGDINNVIGFPLTLFCRMLKDNFGITIFDLGEKNDA